MAEINEVVADAAMEVAETATNVATVSRGISRMEVRYLVIGVAAGCAAGCFVGYRIAKKRLENQYHGIAEEEIESMRQVFEDLRAKKDEDLAQSRDNEAKLRLRLHEVTTGPKPELDGIMETLGYKATVDSKEIVLAPEDVETLRPAKPEVKVEKVQNIFDRPQWDYATEVRARHPETPYIIHADEHEAGEKGYEQSTLTYYEDDDVLADDEDHVVDHSIVGAENLTRFGHGSNNPDLLFVRNDTLETDYEIAKSAGSYAQEVHGFKHADTDRRRRRDWDG